MACDVSPVAMFYIETFPLWTEMHIWEKSLDFATLLTPFHFENVICHIAALLLNNHITWIETIHKKFDIENKVVFDIVQNTCS